MSRQVWAFQGKKTLPGDSEGHCLLLLLLQQLIAGLSFLTASPQLLKTQERLEMGRPGGCAWPGQP